MVSFSPNDVIFVLNKWDSLCLETELKKQRYIEKAMEAIRNIWKEVDDSCILKLSVNIGYFRVDFVSVLTFVVFLGNYVSCFLQVEASYRNFALKQETNPDTSDLIILN